MPDTQDAPVSEATAQQPRPHWLVLITFALSLGLLLGLSLSPLTSSDGSGGSSDSGSSEPFEIELGDLFVKPSSITVPAGEEIVLHVTNQGKIQHNIALEGEEPAEVEPGESATLRWGPFTQSTQAWCTVPGHKESGMALAIKVAD